MGEWIDRRIVGSLLLVVIVSAGLYFGVTYGVGWYLSTLKEPGVSKYEDNLTVWFKVMDDTASTLLIADISPQFFSTSDDPLGTRTFLEDALGIGTYDSQEAKWSAVLDADTYLLFVKDTATTETLYPIQLRVSVPGTNQTDEETKLNPFLAHMDQRGTPTTASSIYAYNNVSEAYDISADDINTTAYDKWCIEYRVSVAGAQKIVKSGRVYMTEITNLAVTQVYIDGLEVAVGLDKDTSDDGKAGYYASYTADWRPGTHHVNVYLEKSDSPTGTFKFELVDYYACKNKDLIWWTYNSTSVSAVN